MTCNQDLMKLGQSGNITLTPEEIININGRLEFSATVEYYPKYAKKADSLEIRFFLRNSQIETLLGSIKDFNLDQEPASRLLTKDFKTTWFSKVPVTDIEVETVLYKKGNMKVSERLTIGEIVSKAGNQP
ncbi:MAG: hypothetical protein Roseis2KO_16340 [Roseivirga sp.]